MDDGLLKMLSAKNVYVEFNDAIKIKGKKLMNHQNLPTNETLPRKSFYFQFSINSARSNDITMKLSDKFLLIRSHSVAPELCN